MHLCNHRTGWTCNETEKEGQHVKEGAIKDQWITLVPSFSSHWDRGCRTEGSHVCVAATCENSLPEIISPQRQRRIFQAFYLHVCFNNWKQFKEAKYKGQNISKIYFFTSSLKANCNFLSKQTKRAFMHIWLAHFLWFWRVMSFGPSCWYAANDFPSSCFSKSFLLLMELLWLEPGVFHGSPPLSADTQDSSGKTAESPQRHLNAWRTKILHRLLPPVISLRSVSNVPASSQFIL